MDQTQTTTRTLVKTPASATEMCKTMQASQAGIIVPQGPLGHLIQYLTTTQEDRTRQSQLIDSQRAEAARVLQAEIERKSRAAEIELTSQSEAADTVLRIQHRHAMDGLSRVAEDRLQTNTTAFLVQTQENLHALDKVEGNAELIELAKAITAGLAEKSAGEMLRINTKPR